jgi:hypothetical protein
MQPAQVLERPNHLRTALAVLLGLVLVVPAMVLNGFILERAVAGADGRADPELRLSGRIAEPSVPARRTARSSTPRGPIPRGP